MSDGDEKGGVDVRRTGGSIVRAVAVRALAYGVLCLVVLLSLVDVRSLVVRHDLRGEVAADTGEDAGPGWPQLRGVGYDGRSGEVGLADSWGAQGPPVLWNREIGAGYSGVIARGGRAYTQAQSLTEQKVVCLEADTGRTVWEHRYGWPYQAGGMFPGPRATPTWAEGRVYFAGPDGLVGCLEARDGREVWAVNVVEKFGGRGADFGYACSPVVEEGMVVLPVGGAGASVVALDAKAGTVRWKSGDWPASYSSALPITFRGRRQVAVFLQNALVGFDLRTGRLLWEQAYARGFDEHAAALLYDEPYLRAAQAYRAGSDLYVLEVAPPADGEEGGVPRVAARKVRHDAPLSNDVASSVLVGGFVYGFDLREMQAAPGRASRGTFRCVEFKTGRVRWSSDRPGQAGIVAADGKLLMLNDSGEVVMVRVNPERYEELGRVEVFPGETCWTAPALEGGRLFLRSPTRAACLFVGKPERMSARQRGIVAGAAKAPGATARGARPTWLVGGEREHPFEMPDRRELGRWYGVSLAALAGAGVLAGIVYAVARGRWRRVVPAVVFWAGVVGLGVLATPVANRFGGGGFVFTWPLALCAVQQAALGMVGWSRRVGRGMRGEIVAMAGVVGLVVACLIYFRLTRELNLAPAWYFLCVLPAAWPVAVPTARRVWRGGGVVRDLMWMGVVFTVYFWAAGGWMLIRTARVEGAVM